MRTHRFMVWALALIVSVPAAADPRSDIARELIVCFAPPALEAAHRASPHEAAPIDPRVFASLGLQRVADLKSHAATGAALSRRAVGPLLDPSRVVLFVAPDSIAALGALHALATDPRVQWVERNALREAAVWSMEPAPTRGSAARISDAAFPNDPLLHDGRQWGLDHRNASGPRADVRALAAWQASTGANHLLLGLADTGIDETHPELAGMMSGGATRVAPGIDLVERLSVRDEYGHGTPVAGVMAARTHDGARFDSLGVAGVCGGDGEENAGCRILPLKITRGSGGFASAFDIAAAILAATRLGARAMNLSFTGATPSRAERLALHEAITHGCVVVAAAGNRGFREGTLPQYPSAYAADGLCIQVGASDTDGRRASFSSYGPGLDLLAPGVDIWTTFMTYGAASGSPRRNYVAASGTSFAAPFVTGGIGLLAAARPELIDVDYQQLLRASARDVGAPGIDSETGSGVLDLGAALALVSPGMGIWHDELAADTFEVLDTNTLDIQEPGFGGTERAGRFAGARLVRASTTFALPDSFIGPVRVWPRLGGTTTLRGGFRLQTVVPWAEVIAAGERRFTLRGYIYQIDALPEPEEAGAFESHLPLPIDQTRFGFTVIGAVRRPPVTAAPAIKPVRAPGIAAPNPFRGTARITVPGARTLEIWDVSGRRVRRLEAGGTVGAFTWNGADDHGHPARPGLYLVRGYSAPGSVPLKLLKLE